LTKAPDGKGVATTRPDRTRIYEDAAHGYGAMKIAARLNDVDVKPFGWRALVSRLCLSISMMIA